MVKKIRYFIAAIIILFFTIPISSRALESTAPERDVAPDTRDVLVMDTTPLSFDGDEILVDGPPGNEPDVQPGAELYSIKPEHRIVTDHTILNPSVIWIDADNNQKYLGSHNPNSIVQRNEGDIGRSLVRDSRIKLKGASDINLLNDPIGVNTGYFFDAGRINNWIDAEDNQIIPGVVMVNNRTPAGKAAAILHKLDEEDGGELCPEGYAIGDKIISGNEQIEITDVRAFPDINKTYCLLQLDLDKNPPFNYTIGQGFVTSAVSPDNILFFSPAGGVVTANEITRFRVITGTLRGLAIGDNIIIEDEMRNRSTYVITKISKSDNTTDVRFLSGFAGILQDRDGDGHKVVNMVHSIRSGRTTGFLEEVRNIKVYDSKRIGYAPGKAIYKDNDGNNIVSAADQRLALIEAETILLGNPSDGQTGFLVDSSDPDVVWKRQSYGLNKEMKPYDLGDDIIKDNDDNGYYKAGYLKKIVVKNGGTAISGQQDEIVDIENVTAWLEENRQDGFQNTDRRMGNLMYDNVSNTWSRDIMEFVMGTPRIYITADISADALPGRTIQFVMPQEKSEFKESGRFPSVSIQNNFIQTIKAVAPPPVDNTPPQILTVERAGLTPTSATFRYTTDENAQAMVQCFPGAAFGENINFLLNGAVTVNGLTPNTGYNCQLIVTDASGNSSFMNLNPFTTPRFDNTPPQILTVERTGLTPTSATYHFTTDEIIRSAAIVCVAADNGDPIYPSTQNVVNANNITLEVPALRSNVTYGCRITVVDAADNSATYPQPAFTTPAVEGPISIVAGSIQVNATYNSAVIKWRTNKPGITVVFYGINNANENNISDGLMIENHEAILAGLSSETRYKYQVRSGSVDGVAESEILEFTTLSVPVQPIVISSELSTVVANPTELPADGLSAARITVVIRDSNGASVGNKIVVLRKKIIGSAGSGSVAGSRMTDANGKIEVTQTSTEAGRFAFSAFVDDAVIGSVEINFTALPAQPRDVTPPSAPTAVLPPELRDVIARGEIFTTPTPVTLTGAKDAESNIRLGNTIIIPLDNNREWTYAINLREGINIFSFTSADAAGNISAPLVFTVNYNPQADTPNPPDVQTQGSSGTRIVSLSITCPSGTNETMISEDPDFTGAVWQAFTQIIQYQLSEGAGMKQVYVKCRSNQTKIQSPAFAANIILETPGSGSDGGEKPATPPEEIEKFTQCSPLNPSACDRALAARLSGRIILAVERDGEAFYGYPKDLKFYYLGRPHQAFNIMRFLGAGMFTRDIAKMFKDFSTPTPGDLKIFEIKDRNLANKFAGKIVLQVEDNGEAYYINPEDRKGYYLGRPRDAFRVMREHGLGINNINLAKLELVSAPEGR